MTNDYEGITFAVIDEHIAVVTLNRPEKRNAINGAMTRALESAVQAVEADDKIRVAILAASGDKVFCAGADLSEVAAGRAQELATETGGFAGFVKAPRTKPWIAAVRGTALGGGLELTLACDMAIAGEGTKFGLPEAKLGRLAAAGGAFRLVRAMPRALAIELLTTGRSFDAHEAKALGVVNRVVADDDILPEALRLARDIADNAPVAVREALALARVAGQCTEEQLWELTAAASVRIATSADAKEGTKAFLEKRKPQWSGH